MAHADKESTCSFSQVHESIYSEFHLYKRLIDVQNYDFTQISSAFSLEFLANSLGCLVCVTKVLFSSADKL